MKTSALDSRLGWCSLNHNASLNQGPRCPQAPRSLGAVGGGTEIEERADDLGVPFLLSLLPSPKKDLFFPPTLGKGRGGE